MKPVLIAASVTPPVVTACAVLLAQPGQWRDAPWEAAEIVSALGASYLVFVLVGAKLDAMSSRRLARSINRVSLRWHDELEQHPVTAQALIEMRRLGMPSYTMQMPSGGGNAPVFPVHAARLLVWTMWADLSSSLLAAVHFPERILQLRPDEDLDDRVARACDRVMALAPIVAGMSEETLVAAAGVVREHVRFRSVAGNVAITAAIEPGLATMEDLSLIQLLLISDQPNSIKSGLLSARLA